MNPSQSSLFPISFEYYDNGDSREYQSGADESGILKILHFPLLSYESDLLKLINKVGSNVFDSVLNFQPFFK